MVTIDTFYEDMEKYDGKITHIADDITDPQLQEIDRIYGYSSGLSRKNASKYRWTLILLSIVGGAITLVFLIYDQVSFHGLIFACGFLIFLLYIIHRVANNSSYHDKYLEYRVLAESLRVQYYIKRAGLDEDVIHLLPWSIKKGIPWILNVLLDLPKNYYNEPESIKDVWVIDQKNYHANALEKTKREDRNNNLFTKGVLIITILIYVVAILFEIAVMSNSIGDINISGVYFWLKIAMGIMSVATIVIESYYGKLSLSNKINDHERMKELYQVTEVEMSLHGETEEIILDLAREFINENSTWYAYQSMNKPGIVI